MITRRSVVALVALLATGCSPSPRGQSRHSSPAAEEAPLGVAPPSYDSLMDTSRWVAWRTPNFVLSHPTGATIVIDTGRFSGVVGGALRWDFTNNRWLSLSIADVPPTSAASLKYFVDSLRTARNVDLDPDWRLAPPTRVTISRYHALQLRPNCGDCVAYEFYVELPRAWVAASFSLEQFVPYTYDQQERLYRRILATLRTPDSSD